MQPVNEISRGSRVCCFDTETHSKDSPRLIESAYGYMDENGVLDISSIVCKRYDPGVPIKYGAMATHHILNEDLIGCPPSDCFSLPDDIGYIVGHNISFDMNVIGNPKGYKTIDTLALSRRAWPEQDSHTQTALFYMLHDKLGLDLKHARQYVKNAHSAGVDIQICSFIFDQIVPWARQYCDRVHAIVGTDAEMSFFDALHLLSRACSIPLVMRFGKHEGMASHKVPQQYKDWFQKTENPDPGVVLAMTQGGNTEDGRASYKLAQALFGDQNKESDVALSDAPVSRSSYRDWHAKTESLALATTQGVTPEGVMPSLELELFSDPKPQVEDATSAPAPAPAPSPVPEPAPSPIAAQEPAVFKPSLFRPKV